MTAIAFIMPTHKAILADSNKLVGYSPPAPRNGRSVVVSAMPGGNRQVPQWEPDPGASSQGSAQDGASRQDDLPPRLHFPCSYSTEIRSWRQTALFLRHRAFKNWELDVVSSVPRPTFTGRIYPVLTTGDSR